MAYQMAATAVTLDDLEGNLPVAGFFKCNLSNICAAFYTISTDSRVVNFPDTAGGLSPISSPVEPPLRPSRRNLFSSPFHPACTSASDRLWPYL